MLLSFVGDNSIINPKNKKTMNNSTTNLICVAGFLITTVLILKMAENAISKGHHVRISNMLISAEFNY